ncbi:hypothetical protein VLK31_25655 [Variovorax sp. H27-G14]|uniref:hypothetical protein n=1 Tax=Variovorax sp. H27-G14 TaxID=3111914 RepID=UPI0038FC9972
MTKTSYSSAHRESIAAFLRLEIDVKARLDELYFQRRTELRTQINDFVQSLRNGGLNDEEIKGGLVEFFRPFELNLNRGRKWIFRTEDDQLCTNPEDSTHHWWTGKGGPTPSWATDAYLNTGLSLARIRQIKSDRKKKRTRSKSGNS